MDWSERVEMKTVGHKRMVCQTTNFNINSLVQYDKAPVAIVHVSSPGEAHIGLRRWTPPVVIVAPRWAKVIVAGHCVSGVVHGRPTSRHRSVSHWCGVASHSRTPTIKGECVRHGGDYCSCVGGFYNLLHLLRAKNKKIKRKKNIQGFIFRS